MKTIDALQTNSLGIGEEATLHDLSPTDANRVAEMREVSRPFKGKIPRPETRDAFDEIMRHTPPVAGANVEPGEIAKRSGLWVRTTEIRTDQAILYLHGGGYVAGSVSGYQNFASQIARAAGLPVFLLDYALAPENVYPAAVEDARAALTGLIEMGFGRVAVMGDSAGGGLAVSALAGLQEEADQVKACLLMSPWTDLAATGASTQTRAEADPYLTPESLLYTAGLYLGDADPRDGEASPLYANLAGLPPTQIHVGMDEILLDDSVRLAKAIKEDGGYVDLHVWRGMPHVFLASVGVLQAADKAMEMAAGFIRGRLA
jgi:acetyl esterase/lipase